MTKKERKKRKDPNATLKQPIETNVDQENQLL
jgi:hypothetical protein